MALKLLSLNIERDNHIPKVISLLEKEKPEVICLQEVQEPEFKMFKERFGFNAFFAPMLTYPRIIAGKKKLVRQGNALFTNLPLLKVQSFLYFGEGNAPLYTEPNMIDRLLVVGEIKKDDKNYTIATTHFTWADDGGVNEEQRRDVKQLLKLVRQREDLVLCGDFNAPRGREIFTILSKHLKDHIPAQIKTTLDPKLHQAGPLPYVVDYLWSTPHYAVRNVRIIDGISDHMVVVAEVEKL